MSGKVADCTDKHEMAGTDQADQTARKLKDTLLLVYYETSYYKEYKYEGTTFHFHWCHAMWSRLRRVLGLKFNPSKVLDVLKLSTHHSIISANL